MKRQTALELLQLAACKTALTEEIVREAFRRRVKESHPDTAAPGATAGHPHVQDLVAARDYLLTNLTTADDFACRQCGGLAMVRVGKMGWRECAACKGSGERK